MGRPLLVVALTALFIASGVAGADPARNVRVPIEMVGSNEVADRVVVAKGDHLWGISERHLQTLQSDVRVAAYWLKVIDSNVNGLRSGDPDLIYPGEVVLLPPVTGRQ